MKYKKHISVVLCLTFVSMLYCSCYEDIVPQNGSDPNQEKMPILAGKLHNEILMELNKDNCLTNGTKFDREEFVSKITKSSNVVFEKNDMDISVTGDDIQDILDCFDGWKENGIFDVYTPVNKRNIKDVYILLDHLEVNGDFELAQIRNVRMAIEEIESIGLSNCDAKVVHQVISKHELDNRDLKLGDALNILECSYNFWTDLKSDVEDISTNSKINSFPGDSIQEPILKADWWSINVLLWDALGALLCWKLGPVSIICAVAASAIYIYITTRE